MDWESTDFREHPKYYGSMKPFSSEMRHSVFAVSSKWTAFQAAADVIGFLPADFETHMEETVAFGRKAEYGSKVFKAITPIPHLVAATKSEITSLHFSPFDDKLLCSTHASGVHFWRFPDSYAMKNIEGAVFSLDLPGAASQTWHHSANIVAVGCVDKVVLVDATKGTVINEVLLAAGGKSNIVTCLQFNKNCSLIRGCTEDGFLFQFDPRTGRGDKVIGTVNNCAPSGIVHLTHLGAVDNVVLVCGQTPYKEPYYVIYDISAGKGTDFVNPPWKKTFETKGAFANVEYDRTTELLYFTMKGTTDVHIMQAVNTSEVLNVTKHKSTVMVDATALMPKHSLRKREVARMVKITRDRIQLVTHARRGKMVYEKLPKRAPEAKQSVADYVGGKNVVSESIGKLVKADFVETKARTTSLYLHTGGKDSGTSTSHYLDLKTGSVLIPVATNNLKVNGDYMAFPAKSTAGGALAVLEHHTFGKVKQHEIRAHSESISSFDLSLMNEGRLIVTGSGDCKVFLWRLPASVEAFRKLNPMDRTKSPFSKIGAIQCEGKVTHVAFHPIVESLLITAERGLTDATFKMWDIRPCLAASAAASDLPSAKCVFAKGGFPKDGISEVRFDSTGHFCAVSSLDSRIRIFSLNFADAQLSPLLCSFAPRENMRDIQMRFVNNDKHLLAVGFGDKSIRRCSLYDVSEYLDGSRHSHGEDDEKKSGADGDEVKFLSELKYTTDNAVPMIHYDADNCLLYMSFVGDRRVRVIEVTQSSLDEMLGKYTCTDDIIGFAVFPKKYVDVRTSEVAKAIRLGRTTADPLTFTVPRKRLAFFQDDIFPDTVDIESPLHASIEAYIAAYKAGKKQLRDEPKAKVISLQPEGMHKLSDAPPPPLTEAARRSKRYAADAAAALKKIAPSHEEAMASFARLAADAPGANRWDAVSKGTEVDDDEWSD